jgi:hypothetical protein
MSNASAKASIEKRGASNINAAKRKRYAEDAEYKARVRARNDKYAADNKEKLSAVNKVWRDAHPGWNKKAQLKRNYGMTVEEFNAMLLLQDSKCAVCDKTMKQPCVDHDHDTGKVRALLCHQCNTALGLLDEDPNRMIALASYISQHLK